MIERTQADLRATREQGRIGGRKRIVTNRCQYPPALALSFPQEPVQTTLDADARVTSGLCLLQTVEVPNENAPPPLVKGGA
ncbi:UNVERIFIED_ORG: hypothetical protein J2X79_001933 [Arthrobacter globiformis]|nr:hypothetical protein [Arthrobacter globiformis]